MFLKIWANATSFCLFLSLSQHDDKYSKKLTINGKSIDCGVLKIQSRARTTVGADESTEL